MTRAKEHYQKLMEITGNAEITITAREMREVLIYAYALGSQETEADFVNQCKEVSEE